MQGGNRMSQAIAPIRHTDRFYIGRQWVAPSSDATISVIDSDTEQLYFTVPEAQAADIDRAVTAAKEAFDHGPWPRLTHARRAEYLRAIGEELKRRSDDVGQIWPRESGVLHAIARGGGIGAERTFSAFAALADTYPFEEPVKPSAGQFGLLVREPVGVVGAIIPWNAPMGLISNKVAPALLAGCTVRLKSSPEAPGEGYLLAEAAEAAGLPAGVLNVVTADREVSELLVRDPRVDKITFTGSTAAGRRVCLRHHLRPQRLRVHQRCQPGPPRRVAAPLGHRRPQCHAHRLRRELRRVQAVRHRPRGCARGPDTVP
jgi:acyl-CoA reductase-like NAD-dependent aldehyde dehydrogenase